MRQQPAIVKQEVTTQPLTGEQARQPVAIIVPHLLERQLADGAPEWICLRRLPWRARPLLGEKHIAVPLRRDQIEKTELRHQSRFLYLDPCFLPGFAQGSLERGFAGIDLAARDR